MKIAIAAEIVPAKTMVPVIKLLKEKTETIGEEGEELEIISLVHGNGARDILEPYSNEIYSIGQGRRADGKKRNPIALAYLILKDIAKATNALRGKNIDILITCGNAGDVRKGIAAANILSIPIIHLEQDIYNPIELISYANLIATTSKTYSEYLDSNYNINNPQNINGYPMATYINEEITNHNNHLINSSNSDLDSNHDKASTSDFILVFLGGDLRREDLPKLFTEIKNIISITNYNIIIAPYRFNKEYIESLIEDLVEIYDVKCILNPNKVSVTNNYVDLIPLMQSCKAMIYGAGMGLTIEAAVLSTSSIKIEGFHKKHASIDLANSMGIPVVSINDISNALTNLSPPNFDIVDNGNIATNNFVDLIFELYNSINCTDTTNITKINNTISNTNTNNKTDKFKKSGFRSLKAIWNARKEFR